MFQKKSKLEKEKPNSTLEIQGVSRSVAEDVFPYF